jgi:DNA-binding response OmpR family regulator
MKKIIVVDDDPAIQDAFRLIFTRAGYQVTVYSNGQALLTGNFEHPDILILDKQLSGADGLDICRLLKQKAETKHIPIIMLSASPHIQRLFKAAGANDFLEKPFKLKDLLDIVKKYEGEEEGRSKKSEVRGQK